MVIKDRFGRPVLNLRIPVTQRCDLHHPYCHREGQEKLVEGRFVEMTPEEIARLVKISVGLCINNIKSTGGKPLTNL